MLLTPDEEKQWQERTSLKRDPETAFADPVWRIANRYTILTDDGKAVRFTPNPQQRAVIWAIFVRGWLRIIIPKARQLGMSTLLAIIALDGVCWREGFNVALIDKTSDDADKKHREKIVFAWDRLDPYERSLLREIKRTTSELIIGEAKNTKVAPSTFTAAINFRGGTVEMLWVSEWGAIQDTDRGRSREIASGALPAVERASKGLCVIETTWKGGLDGEVGRLVTEALNIPEESKGPKSWRILFFPWYQEPKYATNHGVIDPTSEAYFRECEKRGVLLTYEQKLWYASMRRTATSAKSIKEEYPTFQEECWENMPQGSIYGRFIELARSEGRISDFLPPNDYPVHTFWDIGHPLNTVCWLVQATPRQIRIIDVLMEADMQMMDRADWLRQQPWHYGTHFFPWDADSDSKSIGHTPIVEYRRILGPNCQVIPKPRLVWDYITPTQQNFSRFVFRCDASARHDDISTPGSRMKRAIDFLSRYRAERETSTGTAKDEPVHDRYSHCASALAQLGAAILLARIEHAGHVGSREDGNSEPSRPRRLQVVAAWNNW